ncbi:hypothetical protein DL98DRAFT_574009 [Cadophora sp. DSE1049]|nr:hypothetical protein DL98DRAFT_574009 [Cadophora sp. DSE1049]
MADTPPATPTVPDRTFSSTLRRFFNALEEEPVYPKSHPAAGSRNASASGSTIGGTSTSALNLNTEARQKEKASIAMRRLGKAKSALNLNASSKGTGTKSNTNAYTTTYSSANASTSNLPTSPLNAFTPSSPRFLAHRRSSNLLLSPSSTSLSSPGPSTPTSTRPASPSSRTSPTSTPIPTSAQSPTPPQPPSNAGKSTSTSGSTSGGTGRNKSTPTFELTPLSTLIAQSFKDIEMMKRVHGRSVGHLTLSPGAKGKDKESNKAKGKDAEKAAKATTIDFDKVEENLRGFEEFYRVFLQTPTCANPSNTPRAEVHLLAMVCKRSEVVKGGMNLGGGESVPRVRVADCGV